MARGWESKSVEEQQAETGRGQTSANSLFTLEQTERQHRRDGVTLSRKRILDQLQSATHPNHRKMLENTLVELDAQLAQLPKP